MSGSQKNSWNSYLNGGTSQYNFSYKDNLIPEMPSVPNVPPHVITTESVKQNKINNVKIINKTINKTINKKINGGKRKSRRHTKNKHRK